MSQKIIILRHLKAIINKNQYEPEEKIRKIFIESTGKNISRCTIQWTLYEIGYNSCIAPRKPCIGEHNQKIRLN